MEKEQLGGYFEFASRLEDLELELDNQTLLESMDKTAIHSFGWPIAPVLHGQDFRPRSTNEGIHATINTKGHFDYWKLKKNGDFYLLKSLFEDDRRPNTIFLDTRTIRTAETFYRTSSLYLALGADKHSSMECMLEYGGLLGRTLTVASPNRHIMERECTGDKVSSSFSAPLTQFQELSTLKEMVYKVIVSITEMCDFFVPSKRIIAEIVDDYLTHGEIK